MGLSDTHAQPETCQKRSSGMQRLCSETYQPERPAVTAGTELGIWVLATQSCCLIAKPWPTLVTPSDCSPPGSSVHGILQARRHLLQGIFPTQGLNLCLMHWQVSSLPLGHQGSPPLPQSQVLKIQRLPALDKSSDSLEAPKAHREEWKQNCLFPVLVVTL